MSRLRGSMPKFSIFMPTKDRPSLILEAIAGILSQDFEDWELLVEDGGASVRDLLPRDGRIKYLRQVDPIDRRGNLAMQSAVGDLLNYHADDDVMLPGTLSRVANAIGDRAWMYGRVRYGVANSIYNPEWGSPWDFERLKRENFVPAPAVFWTRAARDAVGGWDLHDPRAHDWDYWLRLGSRWEPLYIPRALAFYRMHDQSETMKLPQEFKDAKDEALRKRAREGYYEATAR